MCLYFGGNTIQMSEILTYLIIETLNIHRYSHIDYRSLDPYHLTVVSYCNYGYFIFQLQS